MLRDMHVVTSTDKGFVPFVVCLVSSLRDSQPAAGSLRVSVLHRGLDDSDIEFIRTSADPISVAFHEVSEADYERCGVPLQDAIATPHYFRLLAPDLFDDDRLLYIDADTLVYGDLKALWETDLGAFPLAAARDPIRRIDRAIPHWQQLDLDGTAPYFNSGVLVIDCPRWRALGAAKAVLELSVRDLDKVGSNGIAQWEQYGLNVVFHGRWLVLPRRWNHPATRASLTTPDLLHFIGPGKPGRPACWPAHARRFVDAIDATPMKGWRLPDARDPSLLRWLWAHARYRLALLARRPPALLRRHPG